MFPGGENLEGYQLTFDDIRHAELVAAQPGRTAYIDECGGFGFDFTKRSS